jgi:hypothetical protein
MFTRGVDYGASEHRRCLLLILTLPRGRRRRSNALPWIGRFFLVGKFFNRRFVGVFDGFSVCLLVRSQPQACRARGLFQVSCFAPKQLLTAT